VLRRTKGSQKTQRGMYAITDNVVGDQASGFQPEGCSQPGKL